MIELIVVVIILAILATMVVSLYFATFSRVQDSPVQTTLRTLAAEEYTYYGSYGAFSSDSTTLAKMEPNFSYVAGTAASNGPTVVSVATGTALGVNALGMAVLGSSGHCLIINELAPSSSRANVTDRFTPSSGTPCTGDYALTDLLPASPWL